MNHPRGIQQGNATMLVLAVLADGARHGYDIAREVERRSVNAIAFKHGTLYPVLHSLEAEKKIVSIWEHPEGERPRRIYSITPAGLEELARCRKQWDEFTHAVNKVIEDKTGEQPI